MPSPEKTLGLTWFSEGDKVYASMLADIAAARTSVRLETYIFSTAGIGVRFRDSLSEAAARGVGVRVLVDGFGSSAVPSSFWQPILDAGGEVRVFNPLRLGMFGIRNHRKLLVCDDAVSYLGGFNIAPEYEGDGVTRGWRDVALRVSGPLSAALGETFDRMFDLAAMRRKLFVRLRRSQEKRVVASCGCRILLGWPGRGASSLLRSMLRDLSRLPPSARIMAAYFVPTRRLRRTIRRAARGGTDVHLMLPGKSDVAMSKLATESLYRRLLRAGVRVSEYQPQMLHGKLFVIGNSVYVGSSNLDPRSLRLNYELMVRIQSPAAAAEAAAIFDDCRRHCAEVVRGDWRHQRSLWTRMKQRFAHFIMVRLDPWIALSQWRSLPD
jgi:cardiolipin synthase